MPLAHSFSRKALIKITRLVKLSQALNNYRKRGVVGKMRILILLVLEWKDTLRLYMYQMMALFQDEFCTPYKHTCTCTCTCACICSQEQNNYVTDECTMLVAAGITDSFLIKFKRCYC